MFNLYADVDARSMTPSRDTRSYTLRSVPSSPGRSFLNLLSSLLVIQNEFSWTLIFVKFSKEYKFAHILSFKIVNNSVKSRALWEG